MTEAKKTRAPEPRTKRPARGASTQSATLPATLPALTAAQQQFGQTVLTPIIAEYLARLHASILAATSEGARVLFCYRAGLRIFALYRAWLTARGEALPPGLQPFKTSRIAALKAAYTNAASITLTGIGMQLGHLELHDVLDSLFDGKLAAIYQGERLHPMPLHEFMQTSHALVTQVRSHLVTQANLMEMYLDQLAAGAKRLLLVDSGWSGTCQLALQQGFPDYVFEGAYFGCIGRADILGQQPQHMHGLMFDSVSGKYDPAQPDSVMLLHRHLIESLFEPGIESVAALTPANVQRAHLMPDDAAIAAPTGPWDRLYALVLEQVALTARQPVLARMQAHRQALQTLTTILSYPDSDSLPLASGKFRSHDLGTRGGLEPLWPAVDRHENDSPALRIAEALWPAGQAVVEYADPGLRRVAQDEILAAHRITARSDYFVSSTDLGADQPESGATVAVITRTKNRALLLRRAADSVARQSWNGFEWVVVNDGGDLASVLAVLEQSMMDPGRITLCHHEKSLGMEAASNAGIAASTSRYIVIHDDDDAWHPDFLQKTTDFMHLHAGVYQGVITGTEYVSEELVDGVVREHGRSPYQDWVKSVYLAEMAASNYFAPIAFLFTRAIYDQVGGFDPRLPVLGDWDFNLRFLLEGDIGVIPQVLAYYHHRDVGQVSEYSNSVVGGVDKHVQYNAILRNKYIRESHTSPKMALLANLVNAGYLQLDTRNRLDAVRGAQQQQGHDARNPAANGALRAQLDERWVLACAMAAKLGQQEGKPADKILDFWHNEVAHALAKIALVPPADFNEELYLTTYPDIARSVSEGSFRNGYSHYVMHGRFEGRQRPGRH